MSKKNGTGLDLRYRQRYPYSHFAHPQPDLGFTQGRVCKRHFEKDQVLASALGRACSLVGRRGAASVDVQAPGPRPVHIRGAKYFSCIPNTVSAQHADIHRERVSNLPGSLHSIPSLSGVQGTLVQFQQPLTQAYRM